MRTLLLASASPRRCELLKQIGVAFQQAAVDIDETVHPGEAPDEYVTRLAREKSQHAYQLHQPHMPDLAVLGADTCVVVDNCILGKPAHRAQGIAMLQQLSGRTHQVMTGIALTCAGHTQARVVTTQVTFSVLTLAQCQRYWATGEPCDKAGGYAIQGLGAIFVEGIQGSYSAVVGLPLAETAELLMANDVPIWVDR